MKYRNNIPWDSFKGGSPVKRSTKAANGKITTVETYRDGSIVTSSVDQVPTGSTTATYALGSGVSGCILKSGTHYSANYINCKASTDFGLIAMSFLFDRTTYPGAKGVITRAYAGEKRCIGCSLSEPEYSKISPSQMRYSRQFEAPFKGSPIGWTLWMQANQGIGNAISVTHN